MHYTAFTQDEINNSLYVVLSLHMVGVAPLKGIASPTLFLLWFHHSSLVLAFGPFPPNKFPKYYNNQSLIGTTCLIILECNKTELCIDNRCRKGVCNRPPKSPTQGRFTPTSKTKETPNQVIPLVRQMIFECEEFTLTCPRYGNITQHQCGMLHQFPTKPQWSPSWGKKT